MDSKTQNLGKLATGSKAPAQAGPDMAQRDQKPLPDLAQGGPQAGPDLAQAIQGTENTVIFLMPGKFARMAHNYMVLLHFHRFQGAAWRVSKNEGHRPEFNPTSKQSSVQRTGKMMNLWRSYLAILVIAGGALVASPVPAWEKTSWTKSGEFTLTKQNASTTSWKRIRTEWSKSDGFERSMIGRDSGDVTEFTLDLSLGPIDQLLDLIASAEAGSKGYDAVHHGAKIKPPALPSTMTLAAIIAWIEATPGQPHAIGRYQFIPSTLAYLIEAEGVDTASVFSPKLQRRFAIRLLKDASLDEFLGKQLTMEKFMDKVAYIWAGLPLATGKSAYDGKAGNRATISFANYMQAMTAIFPDLAKPKAAKEARRGIKSPTPGDW